MSGLPTDLKDIFLRMLVTSSLFDRNLAFFDENLGRFAMLAACHDTFFARTPNPDRLSFLVSGPPSVPRGRSTSRAEYLILLQDIEFESLPFPVISGAHEDDED
jgi:hypothetical protein